MLACAGVSTRRAPPSADYDDDSSNDQDDDKGDDDDRGDHDDDDYQSGLRSEPERPSRRQWYMSVGTDYACIFHV